MEKIRLKVGLRFKLYEQIYRIVSILQDGNVRVIGETFQEEKILTQKNLSMELSNGNLKFEIYDRNNKTNSSEIVLESSIDDSEFEKYRDEAIFRFNVIKPFASSENLCRSRKDIINRVKQINSLENNPSALLDMFNNSYFNKVSVASVYRWIKEFLESNRDIRSLVPRYMNCGGGGKYRVHNMASEFLQDEIDNYYLTSIRPSAIDLYEKVKARIDNFNEFSDKKIENPSYDTIARYVRALPEYKVVAERIGKRTADNKFYQVKEGIKVTYPFERVEIDGTPLDLIVTDENGKEIGKPTFILAIDKLTRYPAGFSLSFGDEGWQDVMLCIRHILMDKSYVKEKYPSIKNEWLAFGVPETIVVDNGLGFKNKAMIDACYQLGINLQFCPPRVPQWKASIERFFKTVNTKVIHRLPGTTRSRASELGDNENPSKKACVSLNSLVEFIHEWMIDKYSERIHSGTCEKPATLWKSETSRYPVCWPNDIKETIILLGKVEYRQISRTGIKLMWLKYNSNELNKLLKKFSLKNIKDNLNFKVKYDPYNLEKIYVFDHLIDKRWMEVPSLWPNYTKNLTEWEHKLACKELYDKAGTVTMEGLIREISKIRKELDEGVVFSRRQEMKAKGYNSSTIISNEQENFKNDIKHSSDNSEYESQKAISDIGTVYDDNSNEVMSVEKQIEKSNTSNKKSKSNKDKVVKDEFCCDDSSEFEVLHL